MEHYTRNGIYTAVEGAVNLTSRPVYCTSRREPVPESFPAFHLYELGHQDIRSSVTLKSTDEAKTVQFEAQVFSNLTHGAQDEAFDIMEDAEAALKRLGFMETFCSPIENADPSIFRIVARFERVIGSGDEMPQ